MDVAQGDAEPRGRAVRLAVGVEEAAHGLGHDVVGGPLAIWTQVAFHAPEAGNTGVDQARVALRQRFVADPHVVEQARPEIFYDHV